VASKPNVPHFSGAFCFDRSFGSATFHKKASGIFEPDVFVKLPRVHMIDLKSLQGFVQLFERRAFGTPVKLGHHKDFLTIALPGFTDTAFAFSLVVIPGIVREVDATIDGSMK
jgi:hypothetical protein